MNTSVSQEEIEQLWSEWTDNKDEQAANQLIEHYMYLVDYHVERVANHIPASFDRNDLRSLGLFGLYDALNKFEPSRNLQFSTYASIRIRGSILDGLRKEDWLPRTLREQAKEMEKTAEKLEQQLKRTPSSAEIATAMNLEGETVESIISHVLFANIISLDATFTIDDAHESSELGKTIEDPEATLPDEHIMLNELKTELVQSIKQLNENEQMVISLFYDEELTLTEIGKILNLTTSRISQIHKQAIFKLRKILTKLIR